MFNFSHPVRWWSLLVLVIDRNILRLVERNEDSQATMPGKKIQWAMELHVQGTGILGQLYAELPCFNTSLSFCRACSCLPACQHVVMEVRSSLQSQVLHSSLSASGWLDACGKIIKAVLLPCFFPLWNEIKWKDGLHISASKFVDSYGPRHTYDVSIFSVLIFSAVMAK